MKKRASLYLENSVISMYFADDAPHLKDATRLFWKEVLPAFDVYVSEMVLREINGIEDSSLREEILLLIRDFNILEEISAIREFSDLYSSRRRLPRGDAIHLAFASFYGINYLVTWNLRHLYKAGTQEMLREINTRLRLSVPIIVTPENFFEEMV